MVEFGYLFTITNSLNEEFTFHFIAKNSQLHYQKSKNFGRFKDQTLENILLTATWEDYDSLDSIGNTDIMDIYDFLDHGLVHEPCYMNIDYYNYPIVVDMETHEIISPPATIETVFREENFKKRIVSHATLGSINYDVSALSIHLVESLNIQLNNPVVFDEEDNFRQDKSTVIIEEENY